MESGFNKIDPTGINENAFKLIGSDWMLVTAGEPEAYNMMTASWGGLGVLWSKKVCFCFIRPTRYTYQFMEKSENFTLCFFEEQYRKVLEFCGSKSGRDVDKTASTGITPVAGPSGAVYFEEARLVLVCKKIYYQDINPDNFIAPDIQENYTLKNYHRMYVGEITACLTK